MAEMREMTDEEASRERILRDFDIAGEPLLDAPERLTPAQRRTAAGQTVYEVARIMCLVNEALVKIGRLAGLSEEECEVIIEAGENDALQTLGVELEGIDRPT